MWGGEDCEGWEVEEGRKIFFGITLVFLVAMHAFRAHREAKVLQDKFGQAYLDYCDQTWF